MVSEVGSMATRSFLQPPNPFAFNKPEEWSRWKSRFQQYRLASGLSEESGERQVSTLLYCMGESAEDILNMSDITVAQRADYTWVIEKFDQHFKVRKNLAFERARFNQRKQEKGELPNFSSRPYTMQPTFVNLEMLSRIK